jgi:hypothetical protein
MHTSQRCDGDQRPDAFEQEEPELVLAEGVDGEHDRAGEVEPEVRPRTLVEHAELREREGGEDRERAGYLDDLMHG